MLHTTGPRLHPGEKSSVTAADLDRSTEAERTSNLIQHHRQREVKQD